jgi:hypothetical protein
MKGLIGELSENREKTFSFIKIEAKSLFRILQHSSNKKELQIKSVKKFSFFFFCKINFEHSFNYVWFRKSARGKTEKS